MKSVNCFVPHDSQTPTSDYSGWYEGLAFIGPAELIDDQPAGVTDDDDIIVFSISNNGALIQDVLFKAPAIL